ncbi:MAG: 16S rRNA (cytosine(1402)-N(4))-methyltransferase RsmH [Luminiphilus sp.]|nr:16S rRNA (cytosine(1402)-N(4))-methyltransferase RsmH [Luminiphilus sp.]
MGGRHRAVLLEEAVGALMAGESGLGGEVYVDGTFGRGGHSVAILSALSGGQRLVAFDKDPEAMKSANLLASENPAFSFFHDSFSNLERAGSGLAGVLLDLGVSSPQLDDGSRGFSFQQQGPLDMRMDNSQGETAAEFINSASEEALRRVLWDFGEEKFARRIVAALVKRRVVEPFARTEDLAAVVAAANPAWEKHKHPATRTFQALRIHVNRELADLDVLLGKVIDLLAVGGRLVVISFHSLEDRRVKTFMRREARGKELPRGVPIRDDERGERLCLVGKPQRAGEEELATNPRARSAIMRVAERIA